MVGRKKRIAIVILIAVASATLVAWVILSRPARQVLTEEEVRQFITEKRHLGLHFDVKPETIDFLSLELVPVEESPLIADANKTTIYEDGYEIDFLQTLPDKVWVVEFECEGWVVMLRPEEYGPPPLKRMVFQIVIDAHTSQTIRLLGTPMDVE